MIFECHVSIGLPCDLCMYDAWKGTLFCYNCLGDVSHMVSELKSILDVSVCYAIIISL